MQRVLHIIGKMDRAGAETMLMNLYRNIDREKFQFDFIVFTKDKGNYDDEILELGGKIIPLIEKNAFRRMKILEKFLISHPEYQIVHAHTLLSNAFHLFAAKKAKVPVRISHSHNTLDKSSNSIKGKIYKHFSKKMIKKYSTDFIACGQGAAEFLYDANDNVLILPNSVDSKYLNEVGQENKDYINNEFHVEENFLKLVQVGRLQEVKNHDFSIRLASLLKKKNIKFKMFFVGQGELLNTLKQKISDADLANDIILTGIRADVPKIMAGADVLLMPSFYEGFPVTLVETQSIGLPAVISDKISKEVDLDLGLIHFLALEEKLWFEKIINIKPIAGPTENKLEKIYKKGFDIYSSVEIMEKMYSSFL
jgi:Glycosyltransferase